MLPKTWHINVVDTFPKYISEMWNRIESVSMFCQFELLSTHKEPNIAYNFIRVTNDSMWFTQFSFMSHSWNLKCLSMQCDSLYSKFIKGVILLKGENWHGETDDKLVLDPKKNQFSSYANHLDFWTIHYCWFGCFVWCCKKFIFSNKIERKSRFFLPCQLISYKKKHHWLEGKKTFQMAHSNLF